MQRQMEVALIGAGNIGRVHATAYRAVDARVVAVCDVDGGRAAALAHELGATPFSDLEAMLDAVHPLAVSICTPPAGHQGAAESAARRGVHILCEKPLAHTVEAAEAVLAAASAGGVVCMTGFCHRFHPPIVALKQQLDAGAIGRPIYFRSRFAGRFSSVEATWFADSAVSGGGALMDTTIHSIDLYRFLIGEISEVAAQVSAHLPGLRVEDSGAVLVNGPAGVPGVLEASWVTPVGGSLLTIYGTEGTLSVDYGAGDFGVAQIQQAGEGAARPLPQPGEPRFTAEIRHFLACLVTGDEPSPSARDGLRAVQVLATAYEKAAAGTAARALPPS